MTVTGRLHRAGECASKRRCPGTCAHQKLKSKSTGQCGLAVLEEMVLQFESEGQWLPGD